MTWKPRLPPISMKSTHSTGPCGPSRRMSITPLSLGRYFKNLPDDAVADGLHCDTSTVWRNRKRLVQRMAVWLYGAEAVR